VDEVDLLAEGVGGGLLVVHGALHELAVHHLLHSRALSGVLRKKLEDQVSELLRSALSLNKLDILIISLLSNKLVESVSKDLLSVRELANDDDEEEDTEGEEVSLGTVVVLA
jgi:hypothetical protein